MIPYSAEITYFFEVASAGSLSQAAYKLDVSQPSLSMAIKRLENSIGTALFVRHKHGVKIPSHLNCIWNSLKGEKIVSTVMDIDGKTLNLGKVSDIEMSSDYSYTSDPDPIPSGYTTNIAVAIKSK